MISLNSSLGNCVKSEVTHSEQGHLSQLGSQCNHGVKSQFAHSEASDKAHERGAEIFCDMPTHTLIDHEQGSPTQREAAEIVVPSPRTQIKKEGVDSRNSDALLLSVLSSHIMRARSIQVSAENG